MDLSEKLGIKHPIIQAPMAGVTTPEFVAAASEAGALGSIGAGYLTADDTRDFIRNVKKKTSQPFAVNLFVPEQIEYSEETIQEALAALQTIGQELGMSKWNAPISKSEFYEQVQVVIEEAVKVCSFTFGLPDERTVLRLKENNVFLIGTATTKEEAELAEEIGMDAVVIQGSEAGGHRGSFLGELKLIALDELIKEVLLSVRIPVIAAGAIANKKRKESLLSLGAEAIQVGTILIAADESGAHVMYKDAVISAEEGCTEFTNAISGKTARGIGNRLMDELKGKSIAPYPYQNDLTKAVRKAAQENGNPQYMSLWAGENVHLSRRGTVKEILKALF
ncbi:NAD(P)H-dependent flavin oxidoreductase [Sporosarcina siberiensis]|uniref:Probable nitronate monooxygenase n=1 Tax=Sporosarcina siberiensis TaxID=1365606 RepID=A0ABW4SK18_9BACL